MEGIGHPQRWPASQGERARESEYQEQAGPVGKRRMTTVLLKAPAAQRSEIFSSLLRGGLLLLWLVDLFFCAKHLAHWLGLLSDMRWQLQVDRGFSEWWQYLKAAATAGALATMSARSRQPVYAAWALVFVYAALDDYLMIHERMGDRIGRELGFSSVFGLHAADIGELLVSAFFGTSLMLLCWWAHRRGNPTARSRSIRLLCMFCLLLFFGVFVDMAHVMVVSAGYGFTGSNVIEDGGELFAMSLCAAYSMALLRRPRGDPG
jgi:hypothetical protein